MILETLAHKVAKNIAIKMGYDQERQAVIAYGLIGIFQIITIGLIVSLFGVLFGCWYECMVIFLGVGLIRKATGGAHSQHINGCLIISVCSVISLAALSKFVLSVPMHWGYNVAISLAVLTLCLWVAYLRVPVDSPNKPIVKPEKIKRLRKQSYITFVAFALVSILCVVLADSTPRFYSIAMSFRLAMLWQTCTLTRWGAACIHFLDVKLGYAKKGSP